MKENDLERFYNYKTYPRDSKIFSDRGFVNIDDGSLVGSHWTCFIVEKKQTLLFLLVWWSTR